MVSTRKKRLLDRRLLSQFDDFNQNISFGNAMNNKRESITVNEGTADQGFTFGNSDNGPAVIENVVNVKTLERCFNEKIDREMGNTNDTGKDRIQNAILPATDGIITTEIELAIWSSNASCGRDGTSVLASSERGDYIEITAPLKTYPKGTTHYMSNVQKGI